MTSLYPKSLIQNCIKSLFLILIFTQIAWADAESDSSANPAAKSYAEAEKFKKAYRYDEAIQVLNGLINKYPYSHYSKLARLKIADIHYVAKTYIQAQFAYMTYNELYPQDKKADYVNFKIGQSLYKQLPRTYDRDLSSANEAIKYFNIIITQYPQSVYVKDATKLKAKVHNMLANKALYVAKFYFKYKHPVAALSRFKKFLIKYHGYPQIPEALAGAAYSAKRAGEDVMYNQYLSELKSKHSEYKVPALYRKRFVWSSL